MPAVATYGSALPGTVVGSGSLVTPGGDQGPAGPVAEAPTDGQTYVRKSSAWSVESLTTYTTAGFTIPAIGSSVVIPVATNNWTGASTPCAVFIFDGNHLFVGDMTSGGTSITVFNRGSNISNGPGGTLVTGAIVSFAGQALAASNNTGTLNRLSGNTTDFVDGTNACQNLVTAVQPTIWSARLRTFNALGNPNFEVIQRSCGSSITPSAFQFIEDRWLKHGTGTYACVAQSYPTANVIPGTNFRITSRSFVVTLTGQESSMAAGDFLTIRQYVEGSNTREISADVSSISLLCWCTVALKFGVSLQDSNGAYAITYLASIPAGAWTLVTLPNIPAMASSSGTFNITPGALGYYFTICLACGVTSTSSSNGAWLGANYLAAAGQDNFCAKPVNTQFYVSFVQHEPGAVCTTLMDLPFDQNLIACERYFQKSYDYGTKPGTASNTNGEVRATVLAAINPVVYTTFKRRMAKVPTITGYSTVTGAANTVRDESANADKTITAVLVPGESAFGGFAITAPNAAAYFASYHYTADAGW